MSLITKLSAMNDADLSRLRDRLAALRAEMERGLVLKGETPGRPVTATDIQAASSEAGLTVDQLLTALETAQRVL